MSDKLRDPPPPPLIGARKVLQRLRELGYEAWLVGGGVRDMLLGIAPEQIHEWDIATDALPDQVEQAFRRTLATGKAFGVIQARAKGHWFEIATFREDLGKGDGRRPDAVRFADAQADVQRRDFTINGLLWDPFEDRVVDFVGGRDDLKARRVRAIGDPQLRFEEDRLRLLRAVRFAAWRDFDLEPATEAAIRAAAPHVVEVAGERVHDELHKIASRRHQDRARAFRLLERTGIGAALWPEVPLGIADEVARVLGALEDAWPGQERGAFAWPLLLAPALERALPNTAAAPSRARLGEAIAERWKASREERAALAWLLRDRPRYAGLLRRRLGRRLVVAHRKDARAHEAWALAEGEGAVVAALERLREESGGVLPTPLLDGREAMRAGAPKGRVLGRVLRRQRIAQLEGRLGDAEAARADLARRYGGPGVG